jgi:hypothetical protein
MSGAGVGVGAAATCAGGAALTGEGFEQPAASSATVEAAPSSATRCLLLMIFFPASGGRRSSSRPRQRKIWLLVPHSASNPLERGDQFALDEAVCCSRPEMAYRAERAPTVAEAAGAPVSGGNARPGHGAWRGGSQHYGGGRQADASETPDPTNAVGPSRPPSALCRLKQLNRAIRHYLSRGRHLSDQAPPLRVGRSVDLTGGHRGERWQSHLRAAPSSSACGDRPVCGMGSSGSSAKRSR